MTETDDARLRLPIHVVLTDARDDKLEALDAVVYNRIGEAVGRTRLTVRPENGAMVAEGVVEASAASLGDSVRITVGPALDADKAAPLSRAKLETQYAAYTLPLRLDLEKPYIRFDIPRPYWEPWPRLCFCWVRGRLVKRVGLPGGGFQDLPICNARVTICEVDRWPIFIETLPDFEIIRLRDDLLQVIDRPFPIPEPEPRPFPGPLPFALESSRAARAQPPAKADAAADWADWSVLSDRAGQLQRAPAAIVRAELIADVAFWRPWLCWIDWLEPWFWYHKHCFATVTTDEEGRFSALYIHACNGDTPDIYVSAEQFIGGVWTSIHAPSVRCGTRWDYVCGTEITIFVTDPRAEPCVPPPPVEPPPGVTRWVMAHAIGATTFLGIAGTVPPAAPLGWVNPDGTTDYGGVTDAPFGHVLGIRQQHSLTIPDAAAYYYRWSWRRGTSGAFAALTEPITRSYVRDVPGPAVSFPTVQLGPTAGDKFRFRTQLFNPADWGVGTAADPAGTTYYWPIDGAVGDIYSARWVTPGTNDAGAAPALAGLHQLKLEVFDQTGVLVAPGVASFTFLIPTSIDPDGTLNTRAAAISELDAGGLILNVLVDNSRCSASVAPPTLSAGAADDECGFLEYEPGATVGLSFDAVHPHNRATFSFSVVRGITAVPVAGAQGEVGAASAGVYTRSGTTFSHDFGVATLVGSCPSAAFAATLHVDAKATNGGGGALEIYDAGQVRAFALAEADAP